MVQSKTQKLYLDDSLLSRFTSDVVFIGQWGGRPAVVLKATCFYGEAGGQLADQGILCNGVVEFHVVDVQIENDVFYHLLAEEPTGLSPGCEVVGHVDILRRWDHMRQHTGQHMLSGAFFTKYQLKTISSRLGSQASTIDISLENPDWGIMEQVENTVNRVIMENRAIHVLYPDEKALSAMNLRRTPKVAEDIRVIDIHDFDLTPCGGTHCRSTGEVGVVKILSQERYKGLVRVSFVAGERALRFIQERDGLVRGVVQKTECQLEELPHCLEGIKNELREARQELGILRKAYLDQLSLRILQEHSLEKPLTFIPVLDDHFDAASRRVLAGILTQRANVAVAIVSRDASNGKWIILLAAHPETGVDLSKAFRSIFFPIGGRGGGRPLHVEGVLPEDAPVHNLLKDLEKELLG